MNDLCWNADGSLALICYSDNFVLVGSSVGQRVWSQTYEQKILCGCWMPEGLYSRNSVLLGSADGSCFIVGENGTTIREYCVLRGKPVSIMAWSSFREEGAKPTLALALGGNTVYLLDDCDDADPRILNFHVDGKDNYLLSLLSLCNLYVLVQQMRWSVSERYLGLVGYNDSSGSWLFIYDSFGRCLLRECLSPAGEVINFPRLCFVCNCFLFSQP